MLDKLMLRAERRLPENMPTMPTIDTLHQVAVVCNKAHIEHHWIESTDDLNRWVDAWWMDACCHFVIGFVLKLNATILCVVAKTMTWTVSWAARAMPASRRSTRP